MVQVWADVSVAAGPAVWDSVLNISPHTVQVFQWLEASFEKSLLSVWASVFGIASVDLPISLLQSEQ